MAFIKCFFVFLVFAFHQEVRGHGMMLDPPNRSSLWRFDPSAPINYLDNQHFCGGYITQWELNNGKCGECGDNYADPRPRSNENTGYYGSGKITAEYPSGSIINVTVMLTANHGGSFNYSLCKLEDSSKPEEEECFEPLLLENDKAEAPIDPNAYYVFNNVKLPLGFTCEHCVLRWTYRTGNFWGVCPNGNTDVGCGPQEHFRSCSDIAIV